ncbi:acyl-CoA dehydratase activase [Chloroflexota bacterium]
MDTDGGSQANKYVIGIDIGSTFSKAVVFSDTDALFWAIIPSRGSYRAAADEVLSQALGKAGLSAEDIACIVATGYGAASVSIARESVNDISCQGKGIAYLLPSARTVVDIGGQFTRTFRVDGEGRVLSFVMSEKCAAGSGRLLQVIAKVLQVDMGEMGELSLRSENKVDFTTGCAVFSESEVISRIAEGAAKEDIAAGVHRALSGKVQSLVERVGFEPELALIGGGAKNSGLVRSVEERLGIKALVPPEPQIVAAIGAAMVAREKASSGEAPP